MERIIFAVLCLLALAFLAVSSPTQAAEGMKDKAKKAVDATSDLVTTSKAEFEREARERLTNMNAQIDRLNGEVKSKGQQVDQRLNAQLRDLEEKRKKLESEISQISTTSEKAWTHVREGVRSAWFDLKTAFQKASGEISSSKSEKK